MKNRRKLLSILLILSLLLTLIPAGVYAEGEEKEAPVIYPTGYDYDDSIHVEMPAYITAKSSGLKKATADELPSAYSSVTEGRVGAVKNQSPYGTCWAMSATTCAEVSYRENEGLDSVQTLSAMQLAGFQYQTSHDPLGNASTDNINFTDRSQMFNAGGNVYKTMMSVAAWDNATDENSLPFSKTSGNAIIADTTLSEYSYPAVARVKEVNILEFEDSVDIPTRVEAVKKLVKEYGAVTYGYCMDQSGTYSDAAHGSYYYNGTANMNHMVTIVGWNDDFPASYFSINPGHNGAWLIQNSWGSDYDYSTDGDSDPDNKGKAGYMWISYYNCGVDSTYAVFDYQSADRYQNNYMYDGGIGCEAYSNAGTLNSTSIALDAGAVYQVKASSRERLEAVSLMVWSSDVSGYVTIRKCSSENPYSGSVLVSKQAFSCTYPGFHTIELITKPILNNGEYYSVTFEFTDRIYIWVDSNSSNSSYSSTSNTDNDKTYWGYNGSFGGWKTSYTYRIKGYTNNVYTVTYDGKSGLNVPSSQDKINKQPLTLSSAIPTRDGYSFAGWCTSSTADKVDYEPGDKFDLDKDTTLYAVWVEGTDTYYSVQTQSRIQGTDSALTLVAGGGLLSAALGRTLEAEAAPEGYTFQGWYKGYTASDNGTKVSGDLSFLRKPEEDEVLTAVYAAESGAKVTLNVEASGFSYKDPSGTETAVTTGSVSASYTPGAVVTVTFTDEDKNFLYWELVNADNKHIISTSKQISLELGRTTTIRAVTAENAGYDACGLVIFCDSSGGAFYAKWYTTKETIKFPDLPTGATGWEMNNVQIHAAMYSSNYIYVKAK